MSFDTRNNSALTKRAEQVRRWEESDTNREPSVPKNEKGRKIKFSSGCVFLAACVSGDKDEVLRLLEAGADINTANVDGLTALHQACIDDNLEMVEFLVEHGADINKQDNEGWTPLHATSSCGFVSIARYLVENGADLTAINSDGELAIDLATSSMADYLQGLIDEYGIDCEKARQQEEQLMLNDAKKWLRSDASEADKPHAKTGATALHVAAAKGYTKVLSLLLAGRANVDKQDNDGWTPLHAAAHWAQKEAAEMLVDAMADMDIRNYAGQTAVDVADIKIVKFLEDLKANNKRAKRRPSSQIRISDTIENHVGTPTKLIRVEMKPDSKNTVDEEKKSSEPTKSIQSELTEEDAPWRRSISNRIRAQADSPPKTQVPDKEVKSSDSEVILRRTQSFENDEKKPASPPISPNAPTATPNTGQVRSQEAGEIKKNVELNAERTNENNKNDSSSFRSKLSPGTLFKNFFKSFVPPVRDEESETQRKAHAKRVRETRRSTQGVTLDEIKSAEELVKKKNLNNNNNSNFKLEDASSGGNFPSSNSTIITSAPAVIAAANMSSVAQKRNSSTNTPTQTSKPTSPIANSASSTSDNSSDSYKDTSSDVTITLRRGKSAETKENDKENDGKNIQATQSVIQRRRKPKRRSTGVVHLDMDDIDPEKQELADNDEKESGSEKVQRSSGGSVTSLNDAVENEGKTSGKEVENGELIDYKALWEAAKLENDKLKKELKKKDDELVNAKAATDRITNATTKSSLSELEKREKRAMERKLSEMEEELKHLQKLKTDNERLRAENRALTRVVSKLTTSAQNQLHKKQ